MQWARTFRARVLLLTTALAFVPLALTGWWLAHTAARAGEQLLRSRLLEGLEARSMDAVAEWVPFRTALLSIVELDTLQRILRRQNPAPVSAPDTLEHLIASLDSALLTVGVEDSAGRTVWLWNKGTGRTNGAASRPLSVRIPLFTEETARAIGAITARFDVFALVGAPREPDVAMGTILSVVDAESGDVLTDLPFHASSLAHGRFEWAGESWLVERYVVSEPRLVLVAAAPLSPFTAPFESAARSGLVLLIVAAAVAVSAALLLTRGLTRSLGILARSADAVSRGDLGTRAALDGDDEIARVGQAFDMMTQNLQQLLRDSAQKESLAAVGAFASELAHEVRNPLTAIRVDLQFIGEQLGSGHPLQEVQKSALAEVDELDATVSGILQLARSGNVTFSDIDLIDVVRSAIRVATPDTARLSTRLECALPDESCYVRGDASALRRAFLNLLLNAGQAVNGEGRVCVDVSVGRESATVIFTDEGPGMSAELLRHVRQPFYSTREGGTGLGLPVSERIIMAHGGTLGIASAPGEGTRVVVVLPRTREGEQRNATWTDDPLRQELDGAAVTEM